jgi:hypothetical protein
MEEEEEEAEEAEEEEEEVEEEVLNKESVLMLQKKISKPFIFAPSSAIYSSSHLATY